MTRPSPFDLSLGPLADEFAAVREAGTREGRDLHHCQDFAASPDVQRLLERLQAPDLVAQRAEAAEAYLALLYAAYRYWDAGARVVTPARARLEPALAAPPESRLPDIPGGACYLQLPAPWIWARAGDEGPHEPLDGCFLAADPRGDEITIVAVLGLRVERGGFTQVALHVAPADFLTARGVRRNPPFAPLMEGGAAAGFRSVATAGELLQLVSLALIASDQ